MLKSQLEKHVQWTSPVIQNEILQILADLILENIQQDCIACGPFGVFVDETSDISRTEQFFFCASASSPMVLKKKHSLAFTKPKLLTVKRCTILSQKHVQSPISTNIGGKCFDGAANMSGEKK